MSRIYWDSMVFAYWIQSHPVYTKKIEKIVTSMNVRGDTLCTSTFTFGEVLTGPVKQKDTVLEQLVLDVFSGGDIELIPFRLKTAERFAQIRASLSVKPADAIHLAIAAEAAVDVFLTNDSQLIGRVVPGIQFVTGLDTNLF